MIEVLFRGIRIRTLRAVLTTLGVALGVALIVGTFVLTDTIMSAYNTIFNTAYARTAAVVVAQAPFGVVGTTKETVPATLLQRIRALPQVARAHGYIDAHAQLIDAHGTIIGGSGETLLFGIPTHELDVTNPLHLLRGSWPTGSHDIIIDEDTAREQHLGLGATVGLVARTPLEQYHVVGIFRFGDATALGPGQMLAVDLGVAQRIFDERGMVDEIDVAPRPGVPTASLVHAIQQVLPPTARVTTAAQQVRDATSQVGQQYLLLEYVLLAFGGVALLVASFIIFNTMAITVVQRLRELATLRALGASRHQILALILLEGAITGAVGSVLGLGLGIGCAKGLNALFAASKIHLPAAGLVFTWRTALVGLGAGLIFTICASIWPALRATRIPPIAAFRQDNAAIPPPVAGNARLAIAGAAGLGVALLVTASVSSDLSTIVRLLLVAAGALLLFVALAAVSRWVVPPLASVIERPLEPFGHVTAELARENTVRAPGRTATTAAALTVGVTLIVVATILAQGLSQATGNSMRGQVTAAYVVTPLRDVLPPEVQRALNAAGLASASVRSGLVHVFDGNETLTAVDPRDIARLYRFRWAKGSSLQALTALDNTGVLVANDFAAAHHLQPGLPVRMQTTAGVMLRLTVRGVYVAPATAPLLGNLTITTSLFDRSFTTPGDTVVFVDATRAAGLQSRSAIATVLKPFPTAQLHSLDQFISLSQAPIAEVLNLFYLLLALSVVISLFGLINTLALSVAERTREIGVLRAIGMTRLQVIMMISAESEIIALIGAVVGSAAGLVLGAVTVQVLSTWAVGYSIPWLTLAILLLVALLASGLAAIVPARRAARLDPLTALSYE
jgi:putative ABC transport system permease protein